MELKVAKFKTNQTKAIVSSLPSSSGWKRLNSEPQISAMRLGLLGAISEDYLLRMFAELISTTVFLLLLRGLLEWVSISLSGVPVSQPLLYLFFVIQSYSAIRSHCWRFASLRNACHHQLPSIRTFNHILRSLPPFFIPCLLLYLLCLPVFTGESDLSLWDLLDLPDLLVAT